MRKVILLSLAAALIALMASVSFASDAKTVNGWVATRSVALREPTPVRKSARRSASKPAPAL